MARSYQALFDLGEVGVYSGSTGVRRYWDGVLSFREAQGFRFVARCIGMLGGNACRQGRD